VTWDDGATTLLFPDRAQVRIANRLQLRYTHEWPGAEGGEAIGSFRVRRAKFKVDGWIHRPWLLYELQTDWTALAGSNPGALLEDACVSVDLTRGARRFMLKLGQFKVPFGRQELTSEGAQQLVDRALVSNTFARGRDAGLQVWGRALGDRVEWRGGVFNGNGLTRPANDNAAFQWNARVMVQPNGRVPLAEGMGNGGPLYSEADFESNGRVLWALAVNFERNDRHGSTPHVDLADDVWGFDGMMKFRGAFVTGEYYRRRRQPEGEDGGPAPPAFRSDGWFVQGGYLVGRARQLELAARYGSMDPTDAAGGNDRREWRLGASYYANRHALKVQADYGRLRDRAAGVADGELRVQVQLGF
jgi:phosphate-selective porin OprO/OprP